jgi:hypothetical protein
MYEWLLLGHGSDDKEVYDNIHNDDNKRKDS